MEEAKKPQAADNGSGYVALVITKFAGWLLLIAAGCVAGLARPKSDTIADKIYQTVQPRDWNMELLAYAGPLLIAAILCTPIGLGIYLLGLGQKRYAFPVSLIVTGVLSIAGLVAFLVYTPGL